MRRSLLLRLLPVLLLASSASLVLGDHHQAWLGRKVLAKSARSQPRVGGRAASSSIVCIRTVKQVKGDWLLVNDGWLRSGEVVSVAEAVDWFTDKIAQRPTAYAYVSRAAARCAGGDYEEAVADCTAALRINPRFDAAYYYQAAARAAQGRFADAIRAYDAAIRLNPRLVGAYVDRGAARIKLGDYKGSLNDVSYALRLSPRDPDAHYVRGVARSHLQNSLTLKTR